MFSPSTLEKIGEASGTVLAHAASVVVNFEVVRLRVSRSALQVVPAKASTSEDPTRLGEGRHHVRVCFRRVLDQRGPVHFHFRVARLSTWTFCPWGRGFYFLKCVITDALNHGSAPDPLRGSRGGGNVASSLCTSLLPAQRARPSDRLRAL